MSSDASGVAISPAVNAPASGRGKDVFVGRQPIYDRNLDLVAYELLFRSGDVGTANVVDGDQATFTVILNALLEIGLERLVGDKKAFVNLTRNSVLCEYAQFFPQDQVVMEVLEDVTVDEELLKMVCKFADKGYEIALDDFVYRDELQPLLEVAGMIKIDVQALDEDTIREHVYQFGNLKLLAEKVETQEEFEFCRKLGFDYFQGWFLAKPKVITVKHVPTSQLATLRLLAAIHDPDVSEESLAAIIKQDVSLTYRLLRTVNPADYDEPVELGSVERAVRLLGLEQLQHWVTLLSISGQDDVQPELMERAMVRSRFCELAGRAVGAEAHHRWFLVGQLSVVGDLVGAPLEELLAEVPLAADVQAALLDRAGPAAAAVACVERWEAGVPTAFLGVDADAIGRTWEDARAWAAEARTTIGF